MAAYHYVSPRRSPGAFRLSNDSPSPLHNPKTDYLISTPELPGLPTTPPAARTPGWEELPPRGVSQSRSHMARPIYVPGPPTPQTPRLRNDTPTPALSTPGSWVERRRPGQVVDRSLGPPRVRVNVPSGTAESSSLGEPSDRRSVSRATTAADSQESLGSRLLSRQVCRDGQQLDMGAASIQIPAAAKIAPRRSQLDGASDSTGGKSESPKRQSYCDKIYGSLRSMSSVLSMREKFRDDKTANKGASNAQTVRPARPLAATQERPKWWSTASLRRKKGPAVGRKGRQSGRGSLRQLFASTDSSSLMTSPFGSRSSPDSTLVTRFDDERHPRSFVGPPVEGDSDSPVEDPFPAMTAAEIAQENEIENEDRPQSVREDCIVS
ncbi:MAG: hypothetical protein Q9169_002926 [Polycauliona sp. 2 TL-2023]